MTLSSDGGVSFEERCCAIERKLCSPELDAICPCCEGKVGGPCHSCRHAIGFHRCCGRDHDWGDTLKWKKGTLYRGKLDAQRTLFNLHRKLLSTERLHETAKRYVEGGYMTGDEATKIMRAIEQERGQCRITGDASSSSGVPTGLEVSGAVSAKMTMQEMTVELSKREEMMRSGGDGVGETDQW